MSCNLYETTKGNPNNKVSETLVEKWVGGGPTRMGPLIWNGQWLKGPLARKPLNASGFPLDSVIQRAPFGAQGLLGSLGGPVKHSEDHSVA